eukprot:TRINITY_DN10890_c0_g1_i3.p1 TRINITY_DN10890_c0_g1~~TRINITY_DN10890_c0_g1_i3.p1  ORF type:complete len:153 (+),score=21.91 TRINITY_DN10890_c0_g1_i3:466-924(+)
MIYEMIEFRISQTVLMNKYVGPHLNSFFGHFDFFSKQQFGSIWGKVDPEEKAADIHKLILLNRFNGGNNILHKTIYYLWDRQHFEFRWFDALRNLDIPVRFVWGDSDAVSPLDIPRSFIGMIPGLTEMKIIKGAGHFLMLERPEDWVNNVVN